MNTIKWLGIFLLFGSGLVFGYEALSVLMHSGGHMVNHTLIMVTGKDAFNWIDAIPVYAIRNGLYYVANMSLYALMAIVGVIFLCISGLFAK